MSGQAASYYNPSQPFTEGQQPAPPGGFQYPQQPPPQQQQPPPQQYAYNDNQNQYQVPPEAKPPQEPPTYDQAMGFDEAFRIEKPKFNDLWAGLLVTIPFGWRYSRTLADTRGWI